MPKKVVVTKLLTTSLLFLIGFIPLSDVWAGDISTRHQETWDMSSGDSKVREFPVSVFVVSKSHWRAELVQKRFLLMNEALKSCNLGVSQVLYYKINGDFDKIHIDDGDTHVVDNGMTHLSSISPQPTAIRMFYFDDYVEPISSAGSFPYSISENDKALLPHHNTTWQPFYTPAKIYNRVLPYSEEAHELGHVLLRDGHDSSPVGNIMSDTSAIRTNAFSAEQCARMKIPELRAQNTCDQIKNRLLPAFSYMYHRFSPIDGYTPLECGKNTTHLIRSLRDRGLLNLSTAKIIKMIHKKPNESLTPTAARGNLTGWQHHVFLLMDGMVLDMDYTKEPRLVSLKTYMDTMWKNGVNDYLLQVRPWQDSGQFLHKDVVESFKKNEFEILTGSEFLKFVNANSCD